MALSEKQLEQRRNAGKARAKGFTRDHQVQAGKACYRKLVEKYGKAGAMRILAEAIAARPLTGPECALMGILAGMGLDVHTAYVVETADGAYAVDAYLEQYHLIIQVDGEHWHDMDGRAERDQAVDRKMSAAGYAVIRIAAGVVLDQPARVQALVEAFIRDHADNPPF